MHCKNSLYSGIVLYNTVKYVLFNLYSCQKGSYRIKIYIYNPVSYLEKGGPLVSVTYCRSYSVNYLFLLYTLFRKCAKCMYEYLPKISATRPLIPIGDAGRFGEEWMNSDIANKRKCASYKKKMSGAIISCRK